MNERTRATILGRAAALREQAETVLTRALAAPSKRENAKWWRRYEHQSRLAYSLEVRAMQD